MINPKYHYLPEDLANLGLAEIGENVMIDRSVRLYGCSNIHIKSNVRIDAFCVISGGIGGIYIGNYVHLSINVALLGQETIKLEDFSGLSSHVTVFSSNDDYTGGALTNPIIPDKYRKVNSAPVMIGRHAIVGAGTIILPGVSLGMGVSVGALSLVNKSVPEFWIIGGIPAKKLGERSKALLDTEREFFSSVR